MSAYLTPKQRVANAIGYIVLSSQEIEQSLRLLGAFVGEDDWAGKSEKYKNLTRQSLGKNVKNLVSHAEGDVGGFASYVYQIVKERNAVVHHFYATYANEIAENNYASIAVSLEAQLKDIQNVSVAFKKSVGQLALAVNALHGSAS